MKKIFLFLFPILSGSLSAQWNTNSTLNTSLTIVSKSQDNLHAVSDANGGAIVSWDDNRNSSTNSTDIYAHRINVSGVIKWPTNGIAICTNSATQRSSAIADAGQGNAIITWEDYRSGNSDIYAQKIDSSGNLLWPVNGATVCFKALHQKNPKIISDNAGGAIIVWEDSLNNFWDIYAQRISSSGSTMWATNGVSICIASNTQINPKIESDGMGGAIITWQDKRNNADYDIYAQRIDGNGVVQWAPNGVAICSMVNTQSNPRIEPDGANGAIIGWIDKRNAVDNNIYGQRINSSGVVQWAANGNLICNAAGNQSALDIKYIGSGGTVFSWKDARTPTLSIYAQLVSLTGSVQLATDGILLSSGTLKANNPNAISDKQNGCIVAWQDSSGTKWDIKTQRLDPAGNVLWQTGGVTVSNAANDQINAVQVADNGGGAIYFWEDYRNAGDYNVYAHHLYSSGSPDVGIYELRGDKNTVLCYPNPLNTKSVIKLTEPLHIKNWQLQIFDQMGRSIVTETLSAEEEYVLEASNYKAGVYYYLVRTGQVSAPIRGSFISTVSEK